MSAEKLTENDVIQKLPHKHSKVKNKAPAPLQITAEQLLREATDRRIDTIPASVKQKGAEYYDSEIVRLGKRKEFEDRMRKSRSSIKNWVSYASFEESIGELDRARSVYERALEMDHTLIPIWLRYAEMEIRHKQMNHARNIWDRAVLIMPRVNQFWYKYTYMEELLGNVANSRQVFERWMQWQPHEQAWLSYIKMELRYKEFNRARTIYERFVVVHSRSANWIRFAKYELRYGTANNARIVYEKATEFLGESNIDYQLMSSFAKFEESQDEVDRARVIYQYAISNLVDADKQLMIDELAMFEKRHGSKEGIEQAIVSKRKSIYTQLVEDNCYDYDSWFNLIRMMENENLPQEEVIEVYERAISNIPPVQEKKQWQRYIYLWIFYALYAELVLKDSERTRQIYKTVLAYIPHNKFTFAKVWLAAAKFEIRQNDFSAYRKLMGKAVGICSKSKLFQEYIEIEYQLREFDRCRKIYEKFLEYDSTNSSTWVKYADMEAMLGNNDRARAIFELGIKQSQLNMPELLWKSYIDLEISNNEIDSARSLYNRLLDRTQHVKVWISFAKFEVNVDASSMDDSIGQQHETNDNKDFAKFEDGRRIDDIMDKNEQSSMFKFETNTSSNDPTSSTTKESVENARNVFRRASEFFKNSFNPDDENFVNQRLTLIQVWYDFECKYEKFAEQQPSDYKETVKNMLPKKIKKRRQIIADIDEQDRKDDPDLGWEEYYEYVFPEDMEKQANFKLLQMAYKWNKQKAA